LILCQGDEDGDLIDMAFAKKRVEDRKDWLKAFTKGTHVDYKARPTPHSHIYLHITSTSVLLAHPAADRYHNKLCVCRWRT
jgi:hypothetical protein